MFRFVVTFYGSTAFCVSMRNDTLVMCYPGSSTGVLAVGPDMLVQHSGGLATSNVLRGFFHPTFCAPFHSEMSRFIMCTLDDKACSTM